MSLRYLVPSLGLLACTAGFATAADVGANVSLKGYVDTTLAIESLGEDALVAGRRGVHKVGDDASKTVVDFTSAAEIELGYTLGDVKASIELYYTDAGTTALENAYVNWAVSPDKVNVKMGRMDTVLGLEALDSPRLYRVNFSNMLESGVLGDHYIDGALVGFKAGEITGNVGLADGVYTVPGVPGKDNTSLALIASVKYAKEKVVSIKGSLVYDMDAGVDDTGEETGVLALDVVAESDMIKDLNLGGELTYVSLGEPSAIGILAMAAYKLPTSLDMTLSGMIDYVMLDDGNESGSEMEIAVALLANPTKEKNFATNLEARYIARDVEELSAFMGGGVDEANEFGIFFEMIAVVP